MTNSIEITFDVFASLEFIMPIMFSDRFRMQQWAHAVWHFFFSFSSRFWRCNCFIRSNRHRDDGWRQIVFLFLIRLEFMFSLNPKHFGVFMSYFGEECILLYQKHQPSCWMIHKVVSAGRWSFSFRKHYFERVSLSSSSFIVKVLRLWQPKHVIHHKCYCCCCLLLPLIKCTRI